MGAGIMVGGATQADAAPSERDVKNTVQRVIVKGGMTQEQKNKLLKMPGALRLMLRSLNGPHKTNYKRTSGSIARSVRDAEMRIIGMKSRDWPIEHIITMEELIAFLTRGEVPDKETMSSALEPEQKPEKSIGDQIDDTAWSIGNMIRKGLQSIDKSSIGLKTGWFDEPAPRPEDVDHY